MCQKIYVCNTVITAILFHFSSKLNYVFHTDYFVPLAKLVGVVCYMH